MRAVIVEEIGADGASRFECAMERMCSRESEMLLILVQTHRGLAYPKGCKAEYRPLEVIKILQTVPRTAAKIKTELCGEHGPKPHQWGHKEGYKCLTNLVRGEITYKRVIKITFLRNLTRLLECPIEEGFVRNSCDWPT
ncbi:hypothetical protein AVEN_207293-1 [Araneus ventricosus]|uniref:Uncharacterized protein n=1 Tax=Araneus ventricosus TaxID=182803 RepID=A0A4Y2FA29_ARAVE|nr:hypothetical protein AVEN_207293-1 [Araneus ventricosus]